MGRNTLARYRSAVTTGAKIRMYGSIMSLVQDVSAQVRSDLNTRSNLLLEGDRQINCVVFLRIIMYVSLAPNMHFTFLFLQKLFSLYLSLFDRLELVNIKNILYFLYCIHKLIIVN